MTNIGGPDRPAFGALVISLDFELHWGVRDHAPIDGPYAANLAGARTVIPRMLELFRTYDVAATWATVGFLFAHSSDELRRHTPVLRPDYEDPRLSPFDEPIGAGEHDDPLHFAPSLIEAIAATPRQEIGSHSFSHYYALEPGQDIDSFRADLESAVAIAGARSVRLRSLVMPRNQVNRTYRRMLGELGFEVYRGSQRARFWAPTTSAARVPVRRALRLLDSYVPLARSTFDWHDAAWSDGVLELPASRFLRPHNATLRVLEPLRLHRIGAALDRAARRRQVFHLWWHPHNFGIHQSENLAFLESVLERFAEQREQHGMRSLNMGDVAGLLAASPDHAGTEQ